MNPTLAMLIVNFIITSLFSFIWTKDGHWANLLIKFFPFIVAVGNLVEILRISNILK